ncbi:septum formation protein Maf [bacterium]|nr:septum formation protein Maf [bacterium]
MIDQNMALIPLKDTSVILASQAPWRSNILKQLGIAHQCYDHQYNEPKYEYGSIERFVEKIACEKALSLQFSFPNSLIIAADQLCYIGNEVLYKPGSKEAAIKQLELLNNKQHKLICGVAVWYNGSIKSEIDIAHLRMRDLSIPEIEAYVEKDKPWDCAGSYKIESLGASLFETLQVDDPTTIIGLPSAKLISILRAFGFSNLL